MPVEAFDHYNLRAPKALLEQLCAFYRDVVGLTVGDRPPFRRFGYWLYAGPRPILHLGEANADETCQTGVDTTFNHVSFRCTDPAAFSRLLDAHGIAYTTRRIPETEQLQFFFADPAGNGVELIFKQ
jgi:catechol 2,3-dioxygenase-like lactoylglutathione lyase family enzyme